MKMKISGFNAKKSKVNKDFDVNTTAEFGKVQPILCEEVIPDGSYNFNARSLVQVAPLLSPLFGRISLRTFTSFVPMRDIFHHYDEVMGRRKVTHGSTTSVVTSVPTVKYTFLLKMLFNLQCVVTGYDTYQKIVPVETHQFDDFLMNNGFVNVLFDDNYLPFSNLREFCPESDTDAPAFYDTNGLHVNLLQNAAIILKDMEDRPYHEYIYENTLNNDDTYLNQLVLNANSNYTSMIGEMPTLENADFILSKRNENPASEDYFYKWPTLCIRMSSRARVFYKVLVGLGLNVTMEAFNYNHPLYNKDISILPFLAYYKAWFDLMYPKRSVNFANTNCGKIISYLDASSLSGNIMENSTLMPLVVAFFEDLANMEYVYNNDYYTAHLTSLGNNNDQVLMEANDGVENQLVRGTSMNAYLFTQDNSLSSAGLKLLSAVNNFLLSGTVIGKRVNDYLRQYGISTNVDESHFIASNILDVDTGTIMSSVENDNMFLGQKGGHGEGRTNPKAGNPVDSFKFTAKDFGFIIRFAVVVPKGGFSQGLSPHFTRKSRLDFYNQQFDGVGYRLTPFYEWCASSACVLFGHGQRENWPSAIGYIGRYSDYKYKNNLANGDFIRRATRRAIGSFYLDKRLPEPDFKVYEQINEDPDAEWKITDRVYFNSGNSPVPTEAVRFCENELFDFNRVFASRDELDLKGFNRRFFTPVDDHFIIHMVNDFKCFLPVLAIENSMGTTDQENEYKNDGKAVEMS